MRPDVSGEIAQHCQLLRFLIPKHVFYHFLVAVVNGNSEKRKKVCIETYSTDHNETLDNILKVSPWVYVSEAESGH